MAITVLSQHTEKNNHNRTEYTKIQFTTTDTTGTFATGMNRVTGHSVAPITDASHDDIPRLNEGTHLVSGNIEVSAGQITVVRLGSAQTSGLICQIALSGT